MFRFPIQAPLCALGVVVCLTATTAEAAAQVTGSHGVSARVTSEGSIAGSVWDAQDRAIPDALVRLRNVGTGHIAATARANASGQFTMRAVHPGNYVIEVVKHDGSIVGVGHAFAVAPGETVATFVRLSANPPWFAGFFSNAAAAAVAGAASLGVTAIGPGAQPSSPQR
jgi:hypothetical protein